MHRNSDLASILHILPRSWLDVSDDAGHIRHCTIFVVRLSNVSTLMQSMDMYLLPFLTRDKYCYRTACLNRFLNLSNRPRCSLMSGDSCSQRSYGERTSSTG
jgi:hypothetical protein